MVTYNEKHIKNRYGISAEDFQLLFESQQGYCAICENFGPKLELVVGHQHRTNKKQATPHNVRGLLCQPCNLALGRFEDSTYRMKAAVEYLAYFEEKQFPLAKHDQCLICDRTDVKLYLDKEINDGEYIGLCAKTDLPPFCWTVG